MSVYRFQIPRRVRIAKLSGSAWLCCLSPPAIAQATSGASAKWQSFDPRTHTELAHGIANPLHQISILLGGSPQVEQAGSNKPTAPPLIDLRNVFQHG
jgi:uncharacterized protein YeaO (DUF488 family)